MLEKIILVCSCILVVAQERDGTLSFLPETIFGEKTFLPEIFPVSVRRLISDSGKLRVQVRVLYTEDALITWFANGANASAIGEQYILVSGNIPSEYSLNITLPHEVMPDQSSKPYEDDEDSDENDNDIFDDDDGDFLVYENELYIKFQTLSLSEAALLKISLDLDAVIDVDSEDDNNNNNNNDGCSNDSVTGDEDSYGDENANDSNTVGNDEEKFTVLDESEPNFPEMIELDRDIFITTSGFGTHLDVDIGFTDNDRFSLRGIIYNSTSNTIFTTLWTTDFLLGPSEFVKIPMEDDDDGEGFDDNVKLIEYYSDRESTSVGKRIIIDLPTQGNDISGVFKIIAHHIPDFEEEGSILESSLEQAFLVQKQNQIHGPIPLGVLKFEGGSYARHLCVVGSRCIVSCRVLGVNVQELDLMRKDSDSEFVTLEEEHVDIGHYEALVTALVDSADPAASGVYLCKAASGPVSLTKEIDLIFVVGE